MERNKSFCPAAWHEIYADNSGRYRLCCHAMPSKEFNRLSFTEEKDLPFFISLMRNLYDKHFPSPEPIINKNGNYIFENENLESAEDVEKQWEKIKQQDNNSIFDDLNHSLPPVSIAFKAQRKAKSLKLTYPTYEDALEDLISEVEELKEATNSEDRKSELGDVYFSLLNVSRYLEADPEVQLKRSIDRFINRARYVEQNYQEDADINELWQEAKNKQIES